MLPSIVLILTAGWFFVACSSDGDGFSPEPEPPTPVVPADSTEAITFGGVRSESEEAQTRATEPLHKFHTSFHLMGYKHLDDALNDPSRIQTVFPRYQLQYDASLTNTTTDNTSGWYYVGTVGGVEQTIKYWDFGAGGYRFFAVTGSSVGTNEDSGGYTVARKVQVGVNGKDEDDATIAAANKATPYLSKLWVKKKADYLTGEGYKKAVELEFYKPLARVRFIILDEYGNNLTHSSPIASAIDRTSLSFAPTDPTEKIYYGGTATARYPLTGTDGESISYTINPLLTHDKFTLPYESHTNASDYVLVSEADKERWYHVLPVGAQGSFTLSFTYNGTTRSAVVPAEYMSWNTGYAYTYAFKVSKTDVNFDVKLYTYIRWQAGYTETTEW